MSHAGGAPEARCRAELAGIQVREDANDAAGLLGLARVYRQDAALGHRAQHDEAVRDMRNLELGGVLRLARDLGEPVRPGSFPCLDSVTSDSFSQASRAARISARTTER